jgi:iron-sulfur cluster repair protein YtfE (RIC family)
MKRHEAIIPLSQDHHQALRLAVAIRKKAPKIRLAQKSVEEKLAEAEDVYKTELIPHFEHEEEILFPVCKGRDEELDKLIDKVLDEHVKIKQAAETLREGDPVENLDKFGEMLNNHVRLEEREVFQKIQEVVPKEELDKLIGKIPLAADSCRI